MRTLDLTGQKFGRLTAVSRVENSGGKPHWQCVCVCNQTKVVSTSNLRKGHVKSCGCLARNTAQQRRFNKPGRLTVNW